MKLEIELDLNKIDYDEINRQIAEKLSALDIKNLYDLEKRIETAIDRKVRDELDNSYNSYLERYWSTVPSEGRTLVESLSRQEITARTEKIIDDIFKTDYSEDVLRETMLKIMPSVFATIVISRLESSLFTHEYNYHDQMRAMIMSEVEAKFIRRY